MSGGNEREFIDYSQAKERSGRIMKCPMTMNTVGIYGEKAFDEPQDCLREECAWWDKTWGSCCVLGLAENLNAVALRLIDIGDRLPAKLACGGEKKE